MENTKYGKRREGRWTPIRAKAQDTRANPNSWETHLVRKRWDIGLLRALSPRIMMMMMMTFFRDFCPSLFSYFTHDESYSCFLHTIPPYICTPTCCFRVPTPCFVLSEQ